MSASNITWEKNADEAFQSEWKRKLQERRQNTRDASLDSEITAESLKLLETYDYTEQPDSAGRSLLGWIINQNASVVFTVQEKDEYSAVGWAKRRSSQASDRSQNNNDIELFVTREEDIFRLRVSEVKAFAETVLKTPMLQELVNQASVRNYIVASIFADFYANCLLVAIFVDATSAYLKSADGRAGNDVIVLYFLAFYFFLREVTQVSTQRWEYLLDSWNILDFAKVAMTIASAYFLQTGNGDRTTIDRVLLASAVFIFGGVISFLRVAFLPFAKFVSGVVKIVFALLPLFVITTVLLFGFGYMYWVSRFECPGYCSLSDGFYAAYAYFVGGPDDVINVLDVFTGLVLVVILLNVVIAIVTKAWDESEASEEAFWVHRIGFLIRQRFLLEGAHCGNIKRTATTSEIDYIGNDIDKRIEALENKWYEHREFGEQVKFVVRYAALQVSLLFLLVLGLVTFGYCWPHRFKVLVFGNNHTILTNTLEDQMQSLQVEMKDLKRGMDEIRQLMYQMPGLVAANNQLPAAKGSSGDENSGAARSPRNRWGSDGMESLVPPTSRKTGSETTSEDGSDG